MTILELPDFHKYLESATLCASVTVQNGDRMPKEPRLLESSYQLTDKENQASGSLITTRLIFGPYEDGGQEVHYHFDLERSNAESLEHFRKVEIVEVRTIPVAIEGATARVFLSADFAIPIGSLPSRGMITALLGVETKSCGYDMSLSGAEMTIDGEVFSKLRWSYKSDDDCIYAHLHGTATTAITPDYLVNLVGVLDDGLYCFILETQEDATSHASNTKSMPANVSPHKKAE